MPYKRKSQNKAAKPSAKRSRAETEELRLEAAATPEEQQSESSATPAVEMPEEENPGPEEALSGRKVGRAGSNGKKAKASKDRLDDECRFLGKPIPQDEARKSWPKRYQNGRKAAALDSDGTEIIQAARHYKKAVVDGITYDLYDHAFVQGEEGKENYICRIVEMFEAREGSLYFTARWFYRASDTVIKELSHLIEEKRVFLSDVHDDNPLGCLVQKLNISRVPLNVDIDAKKKMIPICDFYYDTHYVLAYSTFKELSADDQFPDRESSSNITTDESETVRSSIEFEEREDELRLLDMYSGCGAMSTGLCLGANMGGMKLVTRWAVDFNEHACESLRFNHPETEVRNEAAEDFLTLIREWKKLCVAAGLLGSSEEDQTYSSLFADDKLSEDEDDDESTDVDENNEEVFEVEKILGICYGDPKGIDEKALFFMVKWKGYGPEYDTWEPIDGLGDCGKRIKEFITDGFKSKLLPLPGNVDVICGGPPCQGISGFNRFRNKTEPLEDIKNMQLLVFMDIVDHLKPRYVLMENVVDLLRFSEGFLGRYALGRLLQMNYQARLGMMAAGAYGLPQFRMRVFVWGARPGERLPRYPLPTHNLIERGVIPLEFQDHVVAFNEGHSLNNLQNLLLLEDAISDLPAVENNEQRDEMSYEKDPQTEFQRFIRSSKQALMGSHSEPLNQVLYDHRPLELNEDDYERVCNIPKKKGANFRDLPGVRVGPGNKVEWDPAVNRVLLRSGKPLVPDYAMTFVRGTSTKPFSRLWWDETVSTVVTRAEPHNQTIVHPVQDRVLTIRENARLQGFPDYYKLIGPVKQRYMQVGNAVAVPVARALGYALSAAFRGDSDESPVMELPAIFTHKSELPSSTSSEDQA